MTLKESLKARSCMSMEIRTTCGGGRGGYFTLQPSNFAIREVLSFNQVFFVVTGKRNIFSLINKYILKIINLKIIIEEIFEEKN